MDYASPAQKMVGAVLNGRWRLARLIGEGGMGAVYEADGAKGEGKRAIKILHAQFAKEEAVLGRFYSEAEASRALRHPNVVQVFEAAKAEDGTPYLVMELLQGIPLATYMEPGKVIAAAQAAPIAYGVLQALAAAHAQRIVHRDLKPDNLFLVRDARGQFVVKVLDFGIAKVMDAAGGMGSKTKTGILLGTPGYMSPEQIRNSKGVDPRSDLWSMGIIFYEMLAGAAPFPADNEFGRLTAVLTDEAVPIEKVNSSLANWTPFFHRALAKNPAARFQTAEEMATTIATIARGGAPQGPDWQAVSIPNPNQHMQGPATMPGTPVNAPSVRPPPTMMVASQVGPSTPPPPLSTPPPPPPPGTKPAMPTHVSALKPVGTPTMSSSGPSVEIVAASSPKKTAPLWLVAVVGALGIGIGFLLGFLVFHHHRR